MSSISGVEHIPAPERDDWYGPDEHCRWLVRRSLGEALWPLADRALGEVGRLVPATIEPLARTADRNPPQLRQYDARGDRVDELDFHPAYTELERTVLGTGVVRMAHTSGWRGLDGCAPRPLTTALLYLFLQADQAITGCPVGMMDAMCRALRRNDAALAERFLPRLADDTGAHLTAAMFLTEKAGGSDVGANESAARREPDGSWRLWGEKWFCSCPHSDLVLVTARPEGSGPGTAGLGLFLMPRRLDDGSRNSYVIHRLKDKFGTRAMPSGEVGLRGAFAWQVGALERGMQQMLDMVNLTRIGITAAAAGSLRRSAFEALSHAHGRRTFGRRLDAHPLMADTLAELVTDATAGLTAALGAAELLDRADRGDIEAAGALRALTPLLKGLLTERARVSATEAMEVRGGNGFIEDWPEPRLLRDVYVHAIWEGSSNVMALDALRAVARGAAPAYLADTERRLEAGGRGVTGPLATVLLGQLGQVGDDLNRLATTDGPDAQQLRGRRLSRRMATLAVAARLTEQAADHAEETNSGRLVWLAARYASRLAPTDRRDAFLDDAGWLAHAEPLLRGGQVPLEVGTAAAAALGSGVARGI
ncbi:MAG: acyl-CoA dehydrogenase family protein [Candidatus Dormibacteria bacterium]